MNIIGRKEELNTLNDILISKKPEFIALYGRRRIGKTFLIKEFFKQRKDLIFFSATGLKDGKMKEQIRNVLERISETFHHGSDLAEKKSWHALLKTLNTAIEALPKNKKVVLFLDEIPWMATAKSGLLQALDYIWNQYWSENPKIKLIICGSSASWIIQKIIQNKGGLHNRTTHQIQLKAFNLFETKEYLWHNHIRLTPEQILNIYMVTGGVAFYLSKITWKQSPNKIIQKLAFNHRSFLASEFDELFASLFKNHESHIQIVRLLAQNRYGINKTKLMKMAGSVGENTSKKLQELVDAGFISSFKPLYHKQRGTYFRLTDEYSYFYLKWIEPIKEQIQLNSLKGMWDAISLTPEWNSWRGYAFESVCYKHIPQIRQALELSPLDLTSTWRHIPRKGTEKCGAQIDLLFDQRDNAINVCEIKYTSKPFTITKDYKQKLDQKLSVFKTQTRTKKQLLLSIVSANGVSKNMYSDELVSQVVTLLDLFKPEP